MKRLFKKNLAMLMAMVMVLTGLSVLPEGAVNAQAQGTTGAVTSLTVKTTSYPKAILKWDQVRTDAEGYKVFRNNKAIASVEANAAKDTVTYIDESIEPGASYSYTVKAWHEEDGREIYGKASPVGKVVDGYTYADNEDGSREVTGYSGRTAKLIVPDSIDGKQITEIGEEAFRGNLWIKTVRFPDDIVKIDDYGFEACSALQKVYFPDSLVSVGNGSFSGCAQLTLVDFNEGLREIGDGAFLCCLELGKVDLPESLIKIGKFSFAECSMLRWVTFRGDNLLVIPERAFFECSMLEDIPLPDNLQTIGKRAFAGCALEDVYFPSSLQCIDEYAFSLNQDITPSLVDCSASIKFAAFFQGNYNINPMFERNKELSIGREAVIEDGALYGAPFIGIGKNYDEDNPNEGFVVKDGSVYSSDQKKLIAYFAYELDDDSEEFHKTEEAEQEIFHVPEGVEEIAPYAFFRSDLKKVFLPDSIRKVRDHAFSESGISADKVFGSDGNPVGTAGIFEEKAFEHSAILDDEVQGSSNGTNGDQGDEPHYHFESISGDQSIFQEDNYKGYREIHDDFIAWMESYIEYNRDNFPMSEKLMPYTVLYKGESHYRQMTSALNHDAYKTAQSIKLSGEGYQEMYLMMDHGLFAELERGTFQEDLILYSGITPERVADVAGVDRTTEHVTDDQLIASIGRIVPDEAIISTTAGLKTAWSFSDYSKVMYKIYAPAKAMKALGGVCIESLFDLSTGEEEILLNANARFKVLDIGKATKDNTATDSVRTVITVELLDPTQDVSQELDGTEEMNEPSYEWAEDNSSVTGTVIISDDQSQTKTETTKDIAYEIIKKPTTKETGTGRYTATFQSSYFTKQVKEVEIPAITAEEDKARQEAKGVLEKALIDANAIIANDQSKYTKESIDALRQAIAAANALCDDNTDTWTEADVKAAQAAVTKALRSLVPSQQAAETTTTQKETAEKINQKMTVKAKIKKVKRSKLRKKRQIVKKAIIVKNAKGKVTFKKLGGSSKLLVNKKTGNIIVKKGTKKGTFKIKVRVTAAGTAKYKAMTKKVVVKIKVR